MRDKKIFLNPDIFLPERHIKKVASDLNKVALTEVIVNSTSFVAEDNPSSIVFGFGRRACPGKYFADTILWETIVNVLALFNIKPYTNPKTGKIDVPNFEFDSDGIIV
ncbi:uncharacterized protein FOMMEDRAFT_76373 [Fomitiporia mediterranea MF3/22]|uniref:uncharacterized protein n=1 Tax=Fomitiporia mediterranea (strain MF3/22) TaxID=694068 RepID=UPI0004408EA8|nr:uncharacterized protein FOMMEDRAFT_76373 [Fomitiporia mediterranea MF3/22]EJD06399.1 hypothetical protein FOMMEDRAFT_76373 [Fomitiporia mediterranea MF3/22]